MSEAVETAAGAQTHHYGNDTHYPPTGGAHVTERCGPNCPPRPMGLEDEEK